MGKLYILPFPLSATSDLQEMPANLCSIIFSLDAMICETAKVLRSYLKKFPLKMPLQELKIFELNEHTSNLQVQQIVEEIEKGGDFGLFSDAGLACIADPGASLVKLVRQKGISIKTLPGACSITTALQLSGLVAQRFSFHSYLPKNPADLLKKLQKRSQEEKSIQIFIETPYRNQAMFEILLSTLEEKTELCIGCDLTGQSESIQTLSIAHWKTKTDYQMPKLPAIFLLLA